MGDRQRAPRGAARPRATRSVPPPGSSISSGTWPTTVVWSCPRSQILEAVWGYDYFGETRTVDVHVRQLRKKLDGIPIETVWGVGYRITD